MKKPPRSSVSGSVPPSDRELERLERQARSALQLEQGIWKRAGLQPGMRVLDLACGAGRISAALAAFVRPGQVVGIDLDDTLLEEARALGVREGLENLSFQRGSIRDLELPADSFDFVYARLLFQHMAEPLEALSAIRRVLKWGGVACLVDIDDRWLTLHPPSEAFSSFPRRWAMAPPGRGGDRQVGRKLGGYLAQAGFGEVLSSVEVVTSYDIGMTGFLDIVTGVGREQGPPAQRDVADRELEEIYAMETDPHAWGSVGIFLATGRKT